MRHACVPPALHSAAGLLLAFPPRPSAPHIPARPRHTHNTPVPVPRLSCPQVVHALRKGAYHFYCTQTPWVAPLMFRLASQQNAATCAVAGAEKSAFAW